MLTLQVTITSTSLRWCRYFLNALSVANDPELTAFRKRVAAFYRKHNPANLSHVDEIVEMVRRNVSQFCSNIGLTEATSMRPCTQYRGREQVLFETLERKYRIWNQTKTDKKSTHGDDKTKQRSINLSLPARMEISWTQKSTCIVIMSFTLACWPPYWPSKKRTMKPSWLTSSGLDRG